MPTQAKRSGLDRTRPLLYSSLAQSVEHLTVNQGVVGSSPTGGAIKALSIYAPLAQLVEQLTLNQWVLGSSPRRRTKRPVGQAVKTAASHAANMGSIPVRVTK